MKERRVFIIAEAGVNHNGSVELARELIAAGARAGADAVKFQMFDPEALVCRHVEQAPYQQANAPDTSQQAMLRKLALPAEVWRELAVCCREHGVEFLATPFDEKSLQTLLELRPRRIKISSGDLNSGPWLMRLARTELPLLLSCGMATEREIAEALAVVAWGLSEKSEPSSREEILAAWDRRNRQESGLAKRLTLLQCTTAYPCPPEAAGLGQMQRLQQLFGLPVGYSDHTAGWHIALGAVALGAEVLEKHLTLSRDLPGPDHAASLEPEELQRMIGQIRELELALADAADRGGGVEKENRRVARRSLVAARPIAQGEYFSPENLTVRRPGYGHEPMRFWEFLGRKAERGYAADELI